MEILNLIPPQNGPQTRALPKEQQEELNLDRTSGAQLFACFREPQGFRNQVCKPEPFVPSSPVYPC